MKGLVERFREFKTMETIEPSEAMHLTEQEVARWEELCKEFTVPCEHCQGVGETFNPLIGGETGCIMCDGRGYEYNAEALVDVVRSLDEVEKFYGYFVFKDEQGDDCTFLILETLEDERLVESVFGKPIEEAMHDMTGKNGWDSYGFADEYTTCGECGRLVRTSPDSYSWTANFAIVNECELLCGHCIKQDSTSYIETLVNDPHRANTILDDSELEEAGFTKIDEEFESGWYGTNDDPTVIMNKLHDHEFDEVVFNVTSSGQFHTNYEVWVRTVEGCVVEVVNYFDAWGNEEEGWEVNNWDKFKDRLWLRDTDHHTIVERLKELKFLTDEASVEKFEVWDDGTMIEFFDKDNKCPLFRVEVLEEDVQKPVEESDEMPF